MVPHTSTHALTNVTLGYALQLADLGIDAALQASPALRRALNVRAGAIAHAAVAAAFPALAGART
jgi:alanine dehydrogenase